MKIRSGFVSNSSSSSFLLSFPRDVKSKEQIKSLLENEYNKDCIEDLASEIESVLKYSNVAKGAEIGTIGYVVNYSEYGYCDYEYDNIPLIDQENYPIDNKLLPAPFNNDGFFSNRYYLELLRFRDQKHNFSNNGKNILYYINCSDIGDQFDDEEYFSNVKFIRKYG